MFDHDPTPARRPRRPDDHRRQGLRLGRVRTPPRRPRRRAGPPGPQGRTTPRAAHAQLRPLRQIIESVNDTLKGQLSLEQHGGHSPQGVAVADPANDSSPSTAAIWHNHPQPPAHPPIADRLRPDVTPWIPTAPARGHVQRHRRTQMPTTARSAIDVVPPRLRAITGRAPSPSSSIRDDWLPPPAGPTPLEVSRNIPTSSASGAGRQLVRQGRGPAAVWSSTWQAEDHQRRPGQVGQHGGEDSVGRQPLEA